VTGASPQRWWEVHNYTSDELEMMQQVLSQTAEKFKSIAITATYVADVFIDFDTGELKLIEFNPFGAHCGAGASLFNWVTDYDVLHGKSEPELRYLSVINY
jgi:hypothetical protein